MIHSKFPDFAYREAALNPDQSAGPRRGLGSRHHQRLSISSRQAGDLVRSHDAGRANAGLARPLVNKAACMECHNTASTAPASMIALYGSQNGFGWKPGEIIGAQIVSVPMSTSAVRAEHIRRLFVLPFAGFLLLLFVSVNVLLNFVVDPATRTDCERRRGDQHGRHRCARICLWPERPDRQASASFNRMHRSLVRGASDAWRWVRVRRSESQTAIFLATHEVTRNSLFGSPLISALAASASGWISSTFARVSIGTELSSGRLVVCRGIVVVLSPRSVASDNVADEISFAIDAARACFR